jgi:hypothetical protein
MIQKTRPGYSASLARMLRMDMGLVSGHHEALERYHPKIDSKESGEWR